MSYSLMTPCADCPEKEDCTYAKFIYGAIQGIHQVSTSKSHRGGGTVTLDCWKDPKKSQK